MRPVSQRFRSFGPDQLGRLATAGHRSRDLFEHRAFLLPKAAPDSMVIARRCGLEPLPSELFQVVVFAHGAILDEFGDDLWFDDDVMWHRQHFGLRGQVATAGVVIRGDVAHTTAHHSDLVQRIGRRPEAKSRVENRFAGWDRMLMNSIFAFARERGVEVVHTPTAQLALRHTDPRRSVGPELFDRVYDRHVRDRYEAHRAGDWWQVVLADNDDRIIEGTVNVEYRSSGRRAVALCHDIERGLGHTVAEPEFVPAAEADSPAALESMLRIEREADIRATYNMVGTLLDDLRAPIDEAGHCIGFHTFDHHQESWRDPVRRIAARLTAGRVGSPSGVPMEHQPGRCKAVDYRVKGYRPARSRLGPDVDHRLLVTHNYEWLASSALSLGFDRPRVEDGLVVIPIATDDFALHNGQPYASWEAEIVERAASSDLFVLSLHDCYGPRWLAGYPRLLERLTADAEDVTLDEVAASEVLARGL
jgi:peptidoglycan/xylan/chitin deacetylase (PgdA/CDA1 family)